jgi:hypothetical protein
VVASHVPTFSRLRSLVRTVALQWLRPAPVRAESTETPAPDEAPPVTTEGPPIDFGGDAFRHAVASAARIAADSIQNRWLGTGDENKDKVTQARPRQEPWQSAQEQDAQLISGGPLRRAVLAPANDSTSRPPRVDSGNKRDVASDLIDAHHIHDLMAEALRIDRHRGLGALWIVTDDDADQSEELGPGPHDIRAIHVVTARDLTSLDRETDINKPTWSKTRTWQCTPIRDGVSVPSVTIHASRLVMLGKPGLWLPDDLSLPRSNGKIGVGLSVPDAYWPAFRALELLNDTAVRSGIELSTPYISLGSSESALGGASRDQSLQAIRNMQRARSLLGITIMPTGANLARDNVTVQGLRDLVITAFELISSIEGIPLTIFFGQAPSGFSTDDASGKETYHRLLSDIRRHKLTPAYKRILEILLGPDPSRTLVWPPLGEPSDLEIAQASESRARRDQSLVSMTAFTPEEVRARFADGEESPLPVMEKPAEVPQPEPEPPADEPTEPDEIDTAADAKTYQPPKGAQGNARKVLRWRDEHGDAVKGMTRTGWTRASQLASGDPVSRETVGRMAAFARHRKNSEVAEEYKDEPWRDAGYVAWLGWGGDSGINWAADIVDSEG